MKAQAYLIATVIIIASLVALSVGPRTSYIQQEKKILQLRFEDGLFNNIFTELQHVLMYSYGNQAVMTNNFYGFANYSVLKIKEKAMNLEIFYVAVFANHTSSTMNVTVINILGIPVDVSLALNSSPEQSDSIQNLQNYGVWKTSFTFTPGDVYELIVNYTSSKTIEIDTKPTEDVYTAYADVQMISQYSTHRKTFVKTFLL